MKKKNNLKFLSQSVLLEESGLPRLNRMIILFVSVMLILFIIWSSSMKIDIVNSAQGTISQENNDTSNLVFTIKVPANNIGVTKEGFSVAINITGVTDNMPIQGTIQSIEKKPLIDSEGNIYYEAVLNLVSNDVLDSYKDALLPGMVMNVDIIVGTKTLLQQIFGPVFKSVDKSL